MAPLVRDSNELLSSLYRQPKKFNLAVYRHREEKKRSGNAIQLVNNKESHAG